MTIGFSRRRNAPARLLTASVAALLVLSACADFSSEPPAETIQPSLSPAAMHPQTEPAFPLPTTVTPPSSGETFPTGAPTTSTDPCRPSDPTIVAACLEAPWGLAVLPDGASALVGERTTGRILLVRPQVEPELIAQIDGIDATGDGGLLGIALSPHYVEDGLIYAYVTTATDNRIVRIAGGDVPKDIFTGIPKGATHNGGRITFGADGYLYIATGDAGTVGAGGSTSLAGKILRVDEFGKPVPKDVVPPEASSTPTADPTESAVPTDSTVPTDSAVPTVPSVPAVPSVPPTTEIPTAPPTAEGPAPDPTTAIYATGLVNPTGICSFTAGGIGVIDRVAAADVLTKVTAGMDVATGLPVWSFQVVDGGGIDCAENGTLLAATSLDLQLVTALTLGTNGGFSGQPLQLAKGTYGRLLSLEPGTQGLLWATTSNKDGAGKPQPRDDMVVVIPAGGAAGGDGRD